MTDKDDFTQFLRLNEGDQIADMGVDIDIGVTQMMPLTHARERGGIYAMPCCLKGTPHTLPTPSAVPCAVNKHECLCFVAGFYCRRSLRGTTCGGNHRGGNDCAQQISSLIAHGFSVMDSTLSEKF
jgi:hypothetical protein